MGLAGWNPDLDVVLDSGAAQIFLRPLAGYTCIAIVGWLAS